jgi:hypothetical protein
MEEKLSDNLQRSDEVSIKDIILKLKDCYRYLVSKWIIIVGFGIFGGAIGYTYALFNKPVYKASTTFVLEEGDKGGGLGQYAGLASMAGIDLGGSSGGGIFQGDNILELYKSRTMIEKTLLTEIEYQGKTELLINRYIDYNNLRGKWAKKTELRNIQFSKPKGNIEFTRLQDSVIGTIVDDINKNSLNVVKPDKKLSIIKAEVKAEDEFFAKAFNNQIVKNVNDFYVQTKTKKSIANIVILQRKTDSVRSVLNGAIFTAANITDATPNLNLTRQSQRNAPVQRSQVSAETNKLVLGELLKNLEISKMSLLKEAPLIQVIDQPVLPLEKERLGKFKSLILGGVFGAVLSTFVLLFGLFFAYVKNLK